MIKNYLLLLRANHWIKNTFIFLPLFFAGEFLHIDKWLNLLIGFFAFSLLASAVYILNDYKDIENDKLHAQKLSRPLAAGLISKKVALVLFSILLCMGLGIAWFSSFGFFVICLCYLIINFAYSFGLKQVAILDVIIVAIGFNLRLKAGGVLADLPLSSWITIMVFLLALFMAIGKRRDDILIQENSGVTVRKSLSGYNLTFLNAWLVILIAIIIVSYMMYTLSPEVIERLDTYRLYYTSIFVLAGLMRYMQLVFIENDTSSPIKIVYQDRFIQIVLLLWIISFIVIIYLPNEPIFK